jgi:hypothetical protein
MGRQLEIPFTDEDRTAVMIHSLWAATQGTTAERQAQVTDAIVLTTKANPTIKGERLFLLTLEWLKTSRVVA